jgi:hypothetical protein
MFTALVSSADESNFAVNMFGSSANLELIRTASTVKAVRLKAPYDAVAKRPDYPRMRDLQNYTAGAPIALTPEQIEKLRQILSDASIDDPDSSKACTPNFGVRFSFSDGRRTIDVNLCYQCDLIMTTEAGKVLGGGDFDPAPEKLTFLARDIFPDDKVIQTMPANDVEKSQLLKKLRR